MKGVIASICPEANVIDITHHVAPQDVRSGAFFLERSFRYFPQGTVHLAVVDPGVGSSRAAIAVSAEGHLFVGPDNGILSLAAGRGRAVSLTRRDYFLSRVSNTFHGRDIFAAVAAHLARGVPIDQVGRSKRSIVKLSSPRPRKTPRGLAGRVVSVDRFGNLITNFEPKDWSTLRRPCLVAGDFVSSKLCSSYAAAPPGELLIVFGGYDLLEIAVRNGSAAETLELGAGDVVRLMSS